MKFKIATALILVCASVHPSLTAKAAEEAQASSERRRLVQSIELSTGVARSSVSVSPVGSLRYGIGLRNVLGHEADTIINYEFGFQTEATQLKIGYDDQTSPFSFILDNRWYLEDVASSWAFFLSGGTGVSSTGGIDLRLGLGSTYHFNDNWGMVAQLELSTLVLRPYSELFVGLVGARYTF